MQVATVDQSFDETEFDIRNLFDRAAEDVRSGRLMHAEAGYARVVAEQPDFPDAWFLFGLTALDSGNAAAAVERLQRAATMRKAEPRYRMALARALMASGRAQEAIGALEATLRLSPEAPDVYAALARACLATGDRERAGRYSKQAFALAARLWQRRAGHKLAALATPLRASIRAAGHTDIPWEAASRLESAKLAEAHRDVARANMLFREAAELAPHWTLPLIEQARLAFDNELFLDAREILEQALERDPDSPAVIAPYGRVLSRLAFHDEARDLLESAHAVHPDHLGIRCQLAFACYRASATQEALGHFAAVLAAAPKHVDAHIGTAQCHVDLGDRENAVDWLQRTLALKPDHAGAWRELANLKALKADDSRLAMLEKLAASSSCINRRRKILNMALGEAYRNMGDAARAFRHYEIGNALKDVTFDIPTYRRYLDRIMGTFDGAHFARFDGAGNDSEVPVFIVGMPRSGTSLVEQILASHPAAFGAGEREEIARLADTLGDVIGNDAPYPECAGAIVADDIGALADEHLAKLRSLAPDAARITDKMPGNFLHLGLIATLFPNARIVHCRRDPLDVCLSIYFGEFAGFHPYAYDLENLGLYYREYERIMAYWSQSLPLRIFDVRYEDVVDDVEGMTRRLLEFVGLPWDSRCLDFHTTERSVHTRSNMQVKQPIYRSSRGRWRPYAPYLGPLADALGADQPARLREACAEAAVGDV